ncbi:MAG: cell division protein ZapB [Spirochaetia bacterium]
MIRLEQIRTLEERVKKAVALIDELRGKNRSLKDQLDSYQNRITELEVLIEDFKRDQGEIEQGIISAINQLDSLGSVPEQAEPTAEEPAAEIDEPTPEPAAPDGLQQVDQTPISPSPASPTDAEGEEEKEEEDQTSELDIF